MAARTIEARLVISGEDRASAAIANIVKTVRQLEDAAKVSRPLQEVAKSLLQVERAEKAVNAAMSARSGLAIAEAGLKATQGAAHAAAQALNEARVARAAFDGVKAAKGSEQAKQIEATTKAVREAGSAYRKTEGEVRRATAAVAAQSATLQHAEAAATKYGADLGGLEAHQQRLRVAYDAGTEAIKRQIAAEERATKVGATMAVSGRSQLARIEGGRRVTEGMSAPAREARAAVEASAAATAARTRDQRAARDVAAGVVGAASASALQGAYVKARDGWIEMDEATRRQRAVLSFSEEAQKPLNAQALKIGQDTRFSNPDVVKAQTRIGSSLPDHLKDPKVIAAITENAKNYALAMGTTMDEGSSALLGRMLGLRMDMSSPDAAAASAKHASNRLVQFAKSSGADHNDLMGYTKYGAAPGSVGGFSEEFSDAMAAQLRRIGYEGAMAGNFVRAAATKLAVPTSKGLGVLAASGMNHSDYVAPGKELSAQNLDSALKLKFGKGLNDDQRARIHGLMQDEAVVGNRDEFVPQVSAIIQETLAKRTKKGSVNAQDAERISKSVNEYLSAAAGAVDIQRLMRDVIGKGITPALAKYLFGQEHGGRAQSLDLKTLDKDVETFRKTPENRAQKIGEDINAGSYGAYQRMIGSIETFWMRLGQVNDGPLTKFYDKMGNAVDAVSGLPNGALQAATALAGFAGVAIAARGALGLFRLGKDLLGFGGGAALTGSAAALTTSAGLLDAAAIKLAGGKPSDLIKDGGKVAAGGALAASAVVAAVAAGGAAATVIANEAIKNKDFAKAYTGDGTMEGGGILGADPAGYGFGAGIMGAPDHSVPLAAKMTVEPGQASLTLGKDGPRFGLGVGSDTYRIGKEAGTKAVEGVKAAIEAPILNPGDGMPGYGHLDTIATTKGTEAGRNLGTGVADGVKEKAPEVEEQGRTLFEKLKGLFSQGIQIPITLASGLGGEGGGGLIQKASFGGGDSAGDSPGGGSAVSRILGTGVRSGASGGGNGRRSGAGGGGGGTGSASISALPSSIEATDEERNRLGLIEKYESHGQNTMTYMGKRQGLSPQHAKGYTAQGYYQMLNSNWRRIAPGLGITTPNAMASSREDQARVALHLLRNGGIGNWSKYNPALRAALARGERFKPSASAEPKLVKGLDGKEGLDLGDGRMKMPDGSIRSITKSGFEIPEAPAGGFGGATGGRGDMRAAAERMHQAADRMEGMGFHGQIQLAVTGSGRDAVRASGLRVKGRGGMSADLGISMPGAKESDSDWV